ncbi:MAG: hypothetical protein E7652_05865 [Ruminococcaceae bacterium]|nr:hypothetical protein [Oscillospiraceae bacterium]
MRRFPNRRKAEKARTVFIITSMLFIVTIFLSKGFNKTEPILLSLAESEFTDIVTQTVYEAAAELDLTNVIIPCYNENKMISSLQTDTGSVNRASALIVEYIEEKLGDKDINIKIPAGDVIGDSLSLGQGPNIIVQINQYRATKARIKSEFISSPINQTVHRLTLELNVEAIVLMPGLRTEKITACLNIPLSETLIVGDTPSTYIDSNYSYPTR